MVFPENGSARHQADDGVVGQLGQLVGRGQQIGC
jgi:hypothetical protein